MSVIEIFRQLTSRYTVSEAIRALGTTGYFNLMTKLMASSAPPAPEDKPMLQQMAKIGIVPGQPFDPSKLDPKVQEALKNVPDEALKRMIAKWEELGKDVNGWRVRLQEGSRYGCFDTTRFSGSAHEHRSMEMKTCAAAVTRNSCPICETSNNMRT